MIADKPPSRRPYFFLSALPSHNLGVSVGLVGNADPAAAEISQDLGCGLALRQRQQTTAFLGLTAAVFCGVHAITPRNGYRPLIALQGAAPCAPPLRGRRL